MGRTTHAGSALGRWVPITCGVLVAVAVALGPTLALAPTYQADSEVFVTTQTDGGDRNQELFLGGQFAVDRVATYAEFASTPRVLDPVVRRLALDTSTERLADRVSATVAPDTVLIRLEARDRTAEGAAAVSNAVATELAREIEQLEAPAGRAPSPVRATVVKQAVPPTDPLWPSLPVNLTEGLAAGLLLGVLIAFLQRRMDTAVDGAEGLSRVTDLPVLATVHETSGTTRSEGYRRLRTNLQFAFVDDRPGVVTVTGAVPGDGATTVAENLARSTLQLGSSVCLVDGDLRRPSVAMALGLPGDVGLTTVLSGRAAIEDVVRTAEDGLAVVAAGPVPPNPAELLASGRMTAVLETLSHRYETVVVGCSPLLPVADAAVVAGRSGATVHVVRSGRTTGRQVELALGVLERVDARVLGVVLRTDSPVSVRTDYDRSEPSSIT